jgi:hypothetical protein
MRTARTGQEAGGELEEARRCEGAIGWVAEGSVDGEVVEEFVGQARRRLGPQEALQFAELELAVEAKGREKETQCNTSGAARSAMITLPLTWTK